MIGGTTGSMTVRVTTALVTLPELLTDDDVIIARAVCGHGIDREVRPRYPRQIRAVEPPLITQWRSAARHHEKARALFRVHGLTIGLDNDCWRCHWHNDR